MKNKFISIVFICLVFAATSITANAGLISSETFNLSGGTSFSDTFSSFDSSLGHLDSVVFSYDITSSGTITDDFCTYFKDCDGTRSLSISLNSFDNVDSVYINNNQFDYQLSLNVNDVINFNTSDHTGWTSPLAPFTVSTFCLGDCYNGLGSAQITGTATLSYGYTAVPEPSTLVILALGVMGLASRRFKKQS